PLGRDAHLYERDQEHQSKDHERDGDRGMACSSRSAPGRSQNAAAKAGRDHDDAGELENVRYEQERLDVRQESDREREPSEEKKPGLDLAAPRPPSARVQDPLRNAGRDEDQVSADLRGRVRADEDAVLLVEVVGRVEDLDNDAQRRADDESRQTEDDRESFGLLTRP